MTSWNQSHVAQSDGPLIFDGYIPVIDIAGAYSPDRVVREEVGAAIDQACRTSGFFVIVGHRVDSRLLQRMHEVTLEFYHSPADWKAQWSTPAGDPTIRGLFARSSYVSAGENIDTAPDLCELFTMNQLGEPGVAERAGLGEAYAVWSRPNVWPDRPAAFRDTWLRYYSALSELSALLMRMCALGLHLPEDFFDPLVDLHISNLTANWYPPVERFPLPNQYRKGPHSDWGTITVLYQDNVGGLQVLDKDGKWADVPVVDGGFVVNVGDLMAIWTNDEWVSTKHRVLVPTGQSPRGERVSIPFFHQPNWSALIECLPSCQSPINPPKHDSVTSGAYLLDKVQAAFGSST